MIVALHYHLWNASALEMIWTLTGLIGLYFVIKQYRRSRKYIQAVRVLNGHNLARQNELRLLAYGHFRNALFRLAKVSSIVMVGVLFMLLPPSGRPGVTLGQIVFTTFLFTLSLLIVLPGILDERQSEALEDLERVAEHSRKEERADAREIREEARELREAAKELREASAQEGHGIRSEVTLRDDETRS